MNRAIIVVVLVVLAGCKKPVQEHSPDGTIWPRIVATTTFVEAGMTAQHTRQQLEAGAVPMADLEGGGRLIITKLRDQLDRVSARQKRDGTFTGKILIIEDKRCTLWLSQQLVETARAAGFENLDVVVNEDIPVSI